MVRRARRGVQVTQHLAELSVELAAAGTWARLGIEVVSGAAEALDLDGRRVCVRRDGPGSPREEWLHFHTLCVCTGAAPKPLLTSPQGRAGTRATEVRHPAVRSLRDTESAEELLSQALGPSSGGAPRRVLVLGNGGVALEAAWGLARAAHVVWAFPHASPGDAFFDLDAAAFLAGVVTSGRFSAVSDAPPLGAARGFDNPATGGVKTGGGEGGTFGPALGPEWLATLKKLIGDRGNLPGGLLEVRPDCELSELQEGGSGAVTAVLTSGERVECDVVVNATGVVPNTAWLEGKVQLAPDGGVLVDSRMESSVPGVFAAGDSCSVREDCMPPGQWFQMRLWGQAETMGARAGQCMGKSREDAMRALETSMAFEIFTHATRFFGMRVVLLGRYNGQGLEEEPESDLVTYSRVLESTEDGPSFVRVLLLRGRMQGAVLIGETDLEETFENLILDGLDLSAYGPTILDPEVDLEAYFD